MDPFDGRERQDAARALREGLEDLRAEPMGEEEMMDLIREAGRQPAPRRRWRAPAAAALVLIAAGGALLLLARGRPPGLFAEDPQVAGDEELEVRPPPLRVARSEAWDREAYRALLTVRPGGEATLRLSYEPEDGEARIRASSALMPVAPRPKGAPEGTLVAVLLAAEADTPWRDLRSALSGPTGVLYLAGEEPAGTLGAVAAIVPRTFGERAAMQEIQRLGAAVTPQDLVRAVPPERVLQLRITRDELGTRYRFGRHPLVAPVSPRFGLGDVTCSDEALEGRGDGPLLPVLASLVGGSGEVPERWLVLLEAGTGVRYVDVLRALESLPGGWLLDLPISGRDLSGLELPAPLDATDAALLDEAGGDGSRVIVNVDAAGRIQCRGKVLEPGEIVFGEPGTEVWLRADRRAPFAPCRRVLDLAVAADCVPRLLFAPADPEIPVERSARLPPDPGTDVSGRVELPRGEGGRLDTPAQEFHPEEGVVLAVPAEATAGAVLPAVLRLLRLRAAWVRIE